MKVTYLSHNNYEENPMCQYCIQQTKQQGVDTEILKIEDLGDYMERCKHSRFALENGMDTYVFDQVRLLIGSEKPDFFYSDLDAYVKDVKSVPLNSVAADIYNNKVRYNNGTFFYGCQDFNKYYYDIYEKYNKGLVTNGVYDVNYTVFFKYQAPDNIRPNPYFFADGKQGRHFYISQFNRYKNCTEDRRVVYYTWNNTPRPDLLNKQYWSFDSEHNFNKNGSLLNRVWYYNINENIDENFYLWKSQMSYTLQNPVLQFIEV